MSTIPVSTIALVTSKTSSKINFAHVVGEMRRSLDKSQHSTYTQTWDHDDIATFDFESTRIVLALEEDAISIRETPADCLFISVGPSASAPQGHEPEIAYEQLCSIIVERICTCYEIKPVYWLQIPGSVTSETVDDFFENIAPAHNEPSTMSFEDTAISAEPEQPPQENVIHMSAASSRLPRLHTKEAGRQQASTGPQPIHRGNPMNIANDVAPLHQRDSDRLRAIRAALYGAADAPNAGKLQKGSSIIRHTAKAFDATMVVVCLPVGAAVLTYQAFKGGEYKRSIKAISLAGLLLASSKVIPAISLSKLFS